MSLADLIRGKPQRDSGGVATVTVATPATVTAAASTSVANVASVTVANREKRKTQPADSAQEFARWLLHFEDRDPVEVTFDPRVDHAGALGVYPLAIAAEPLPDAAPVREVPMDIELLAHELLKARRLIDDDLEALPVMVARDERATRELVEAMHVQAFGRCRRCVHRRSPGLADSFFCTSDARADLEIHYGLLRKLPEDLGRSCAVFEARQN